MFECSQVQFLVHLDNREPASVFSPSESLWQFLNCPSISCIEINIITKSRLFSLKLVAFFSCANGLSQLLSISYHFLFSANLFGPVYFPLSDSYDTNIKVTIVLNNQRYEKNLGPLKLVDLSTLFTVYTQCPAQVRGCAQCVHMNESVNNEPHYNITVS